MAAAQLVQGEAGAPDGIEQWCSEVLCNVKANDVQYTVY